MFWLPVRKHRMLTRLKQMKKLISCLAIMISRPRMLNNVWSGVALRNWCLMVCQRMSSRASLRLIRFPSPRRDKSWTVTQCLFYTWTKLKHIRNHGMFNFITYNLVLFKYVHLKHTSNRPLLFHFCKIVYYFQLCFISFLINLFLKTKLH